MLLKSLKYSLENGTILHSKTTLKKNEILVSEGEISENLYLVKSGALILSKNFADREQVIRLGYRGSLITTLDSFLNSTPTVYDLKSIRETTVLKFEKNTVLNYFENSKSAYLDFLIEMINQQTERELDLLFSSSAERFAKLLARSPQVFQEIPYKYIASYLRIAPETLSRLLKS